jgi:hypothetical protein
MRRAVFRVGLAVFLMFFSSPSNGAAQQEIFNEKTGSFVDYYNKKDFGRLVNLFHFPKDYTEAQLKEDKEAIGKTLQLYFEEFGKIAGFEKVEDPPRYLFVAIGSATVPYWEKNPEGDTVTYKVKFSRDGEGYLVLVFSYILKEWEIRQVDFGLPAGRPQSEKRISAIFQKWEKLMAP